MKGVLRGPAPHSSSKRSAKGTFQISFPVCASSRCTTSCLAFSSRQTRLVPATTGAENPPPTGVFQTGLRSLGRETGTGSASGTRQSRVSPCHCGQSPSGSRKEIITMHEPMAAEPRQRRSARGPGQQRFLRPTTRRRIPTPWTVRRSRRLGPAAVRSRRKSLST